MIVKEIAKRKGQEILIYWLEQLQLGAVIYTGLLCLTMLKSTKDLVDYKSKENQYWFSEAIIYYHMCQFKAENRKQILCTTAKIGLVVKTFIQNK